MRLIISNRVQKEIIIKLLNLAEFSNRNIKEFITLGDHHSVIGETTNKKKLVIHIPSQEVTINNLVKNKYNDNKFYFYRFNLNKLLRKKIFTVTAQDANKSGLYALIVQEFNSLHAIVD